MKLTSLLDLSKAGFNDQQVDVVASLLDEHGKSFEKNAITREYLDGRIAQSNLRIVQWMVGVGLGLAALIVAVYLRF